MSRLIRYIMLVSALFLQSNITAFAAAERIEKKVKQVIVEESLKTDVPTSLAMAIAKTSSSFRPDFEGENGARGVMQILPDTAESIGVDPENLWNPNVNVRLGLNIISNLLKRTSGNWIETVTAYNTQRFQLNSTAAGHNVAETLHWERRFAEQLALQDPIHKRRQDVIVGDAKALAKNDTLNGYEPNEFNASRKSIGKRQSNNVSFPNEEPDRACIQSNERNIVERTVPDLNRSEITEIVNFDPSTTAQIIIEKSFGDRKDGIRVIVIQHPDDEADLIEIPITSELIWKPGTRVQKLIQRNKPYQRWLNKFVVNSYGDW